ncbi:MAG TPA: hypothetical protein VFW92_08935 [Candidatus Limnocylindrales bacterium]|nr:hypothetical protein [Candidatus Limnocylindrales bacterium]
MIIGRPSAENVQWRSPRPRLVAGAVLALLLAVAIAIQGAAAAIALQSARSLPAANTDYAVTIDDGVVPVTPNGEAAAIARHYLDEQTPELAAPQLHGAPTVINETAVLARDAAGLEAALPKAALAAHPDRVLWIVEVNGDLLDLHDLPWSTAGAPGPVGTIVIDDASGTILGVYPHVPD